LATLPLAHPASAIAATAPKPDVRHERVSVIVKQD
jgi:hypothetical protein